jgi:hypothetical protein
MVEDALFMRKLKALNLSSPTKITHIRSSSIM